MIDLERGITDLPSPAGRREWLVTNGLGGYASGTVGGPRTRCYHGLLVAALDPPLGRTLLASHLDETVRYDGRDYALAAHRWADGTVDPRGFVHLDRFHLEGTVPTWTYACGDALLEKRVWMAEGATTTYVQYTVPRARGPVTLRAKAFVNHRNHHATTQAGDWQMRVSSTDEGVRVDAYDGATPVFLRSDVASIVAEHVWYRDYHLAAEAARGLDAHEDALHAATVEATVAPEVPLTLTTRAGTPGAARPGTGPTTRAPCGAGSWAPSSRRTSGSTTIRPGPARSSRRCAGTWPTTASGASANSSMGPPVHAAGHPGPGLGRGAAPGGVDGDARRRPRVLNEAEGISRRGRAARRRP